jgi:hypothetical protein
VRTVLLAAIGGLLGRFPDLRLAAAPGEVDHSSKLLPLTVRSLPAHLAAG